MSRRGIVFTLALSFLVASSPMTAQKQQTPAKAPPAKNSKDKEQDERAKSKSKELDNNYLKNWLEVDATYIITDEERAAFKRLTTDDEREQFIENFWLRRDPTPDTLENEYRDEHYERIAYANERFTSGKPGWKTDRGRIYIIHGKPDEIDAHPAGGPYQRKFDEGGGNTSTYPFEVWTYRYIEGLGNNVEIEFVDPSLSGEYRLTIDPGEKDALTYVPGAGLTSDEEANGGNKTDRFARSDGSTLGTDENTAMRYKQFDRLNLLANIFKPPEVKFKDLEEIVTTKLSFNLLPFEVKTDMVRVTEESLLLPITLQFKYKDLAFQEQEGIERALAHVYGRITSIGGRVCPTCTFEETISKDVPGAGFQQFLDTNGVYQKIVALGPGTYKLDLVIKDIHSGNVGTKQMSFRVPRIPDAKLDSSSLILAERIEQLSPRQISTGPFILGSYKVVPNVMKEFRKDQPLNFWLQVYSLKVDEGTHKPSATIETLVTRNGKEVQKVVDNASEPSSAGQQMTFTKSLPLSGMEPGEYSIQVKVTDNLTKEVTLKNEKFKVK